MAPSPEHDNEPKAPDKTDGKKTSTTKLGSNLLDLESTSGELQESSVSTLDDGQLKALLDEAINYKCPKDREGKSQIFKVLLQEAEEDERNARAASASGPQLARYYNTQAAGLRHRHRAGGGGGRSHHQSVAESLTHGGSLQNLAQPELFDTANYLGTSSAHCRRRTSGKKGTVSARQREGGSLPSNVNSTGGGRGFVSSFEGQRTKMSVEMAPINRSEQNRVSNNDNNSEKVNNNRCGVGDYVIDLTGHVDPDETKSLLDHDVLGHNYESSSHTTTYSQHETCVSQSQEEQMPVVNRTRYTSPRTNIDTAISFPQLISTASSIEGPALIPLQLQPDYTSVKSCVDRTSDSEIKSEPLSITASLRSSNYRMTTSSNPIVGRQPLQQLELSMGAKKAFDENGNTVSTVDSNGKTKKKKPRGDKKVTILNSEQVVGHRADIIENIDLLVKYVESSDAEGTNLTAKRGAKHHQQQRRSTSGRTLNSKGNKSSESSRVTKSNSLEEISTSKLDDLVVSKGDRRSWGTEDGEQYYCKKGQQQEQNVEAIPLTPTDPTLEMSEFQVVNKKKKSRKRRPDTGGNVGASVGGVTTHEGPGGFTETVMVGGGVPPGGGACNSVVIMNTSSSGGARNRRKSSCSMPVSDKSDSSDVDSVHSLPVSAKLAGGCASYADMASQPSPPSGLSVAPTEHQYMGAPVYQQPHQPAVCRTPCLNSVEHFPELPQPPALVNNVPPPPAPVPAVVPAVAPAPPAVTHAGHASHTAHTGHAVHTGHGAGGGATSASSANSGSIVGSVVGSCAVTTVDHRRPAVIIPVSNRDSVTEVSGLTFGFEVNEQLLALGAGPECTPPPPVHHQLPVQQQQQQHQQQAVVPVQTQTTAVQTGEDCRPQTAPADSFTARFVAPVILNNYNHDKIVSYVEQEWEKIMHQPGGKVRYYSGQ